MTPGAKSRPVSVLFDLFDCNPLWPYMQAMLQSGAIIDFYQEPDNLQRNCENQAQIDYQNHKEARSNENLLDQSLAKEVHLGFACVIPIKDIHLIKDAMVVPLDIVEQHAINNKGLPVPILRQTHDQTITHLPDSTSGNKLLDTKNFAEKIYGFCINWIIHQILALRFTFPAQLILIQKFDFAKAYRRVLYNGQSVASCIPVLQGLAYIQM
jgi:hypothetical protein